MRVRLACLMSLAGCLLLVQPAAAQYSRVVAQRNNLSDGFYERIGVGFNFHLPGPGGGVTFNNGGGAALPPFGGHRVGGDPSLGIGFAGKGGSGSLNFTFGQGSNRSNSSTAVGLTVPNGGTGFISDTRQRPFVTGIIPVVGGFVPDLPAWPMPVPTRTSPIQQRLRRIKAGELKQSPARDEPAAEVAAENLVPAGAPVPPAAAGSSAEHGDLSVAEIRRRQAAGDVADQQEVLALIERAKGAEADGKANVASIYYKMAARRAEGELQRQLEAKAASLKP